MKGSGNMEVIVAKVATLLSRYMSKAYCVCTWPSLSVLSVTNVHPLVQDMMRACVTVPLCTVICAISVHIHYSVTIH